MLTIDEGLTNRLQVIAEKLTESHARQGLPVAFLPEDKPLAENEVALEFPEGGQKVVVGDHSVRGYRIVRPL